MMQKKSLSKVIKTYSWRFSQIYNVIISCNGFLFIQTIVIPLIQSISADRTWPSYLIDLFN